MALANVEDEYKKDPNLKREDVRCLLEWVEHQPHLPKITGEEIILGFFQSGSGIVCFRITSYFVLAQLLLQQ